MGQQRCKDGIFGEAPGRHTRCPSERRTFPFPLQGRCSIKTNTQLGHDLHPTTASPNPITQKAESLVKDLRVEASLVCLVRSFRSALIPDGG